VVVRATSTGRGPARAAVLTVLTAVATVAGHLAGGGALPDLGVLVVLLPALAAAFTTVADRSRSGGGALAVLGAGQLALHHLIEVTAPAHGAHHLAAATPSGRMLAVHALATLLIAAGLRFADRGIAAVGAALRHRVPRRLHPRPARRPLATLAVPGPAVALRLASALAAAHLRRGPPVGC
jgi:hypothetical protein